MRTLLLNWVNTNFVPIFTVEGIKKVKGARNQGVKGSSENPRILCDAVAYLVILFLAFFIIPTASGIAQDLSNKVCLTCHSGIDTSKTVHEGKICIDCHRDIKKLPHPQEPRRIECTLCHPSMGKSLGMDVHARARKNGNLKAPDCTTCHGAHNVAPRSSPDSPMNPKNMQSFCITCHQNVPVSKTYHKETSLKSMVCQSCHSAKSGGLPYIDFKSFKNSVHKVLECVDCHRDIKEVPHEEKLQEVNCGNCHQGELQLYSESIHGKARLNGIVEAPQCWDCHGSHNIHAGRDTNSAVYPKHIPSTCGDVKCHSNTKLAEKYGIPIENPFKGYEKSIHAKKLNEGNTSAATCQRCHGGHAILPLTDPRSSIFKGNIPRTCSQCHKKIYVEYVQSIHWKGYLKGDREAPVCTDCHLEHEILAHTNPKSTVFKAKVPTLCTDCHENTRIAERYGISVMALSSYLKSYHGLAMKSGNLEAANCTSCHEQHKILPSSDSDSTVNLNNLRGTCGKCHPGVGKMMMAQEMKVHKESPGLSGKVLELVKTIYIWVICVSVLSMLIFGLVDLTAKTKRHEVSIQEVEVKTEKYYIRFNFTERMLHFTLFVSFVLLAYTGFAHKFPDSLWAYPVSKWLPFIVRDIIHRVSGVVLIINMLLQFIFLIFTKRGREQFLALLPRMQDLFDALHLLKYNLGLVKIPPAFSRFSFIEKFEYWALVWGCVVMGITGVSIWFKEIFLSYFPKWVIDLFLIIHYYEAVLASLAILVWHFYWTIFNPHIYPMDTIWLNGKISEERLKEEHPLEWETLTKK